MAGVQQLESAQRTRFTASRAVYFRGIWTLLKSEDMTHLYRKVSTAGSTHFQLIEDSQSTKCRTYIRHVQNCLPIDSVNWTIQTAAHPSIAGSLSAAFHEHQLQREKELSENRKYIGRLTAIMQFLMRLALAFRGYRESEDSLHRCKYILAGVYRTA